MIVPVERAMQSCKLLTRKEACEFPSAVGPDVPRRVRGDVVAGDRMVEDVAEDLEAVVGTSWGGSAVVVEPSMNHRRGDLVQAMGAKCREQLTSQALFPPLDRGRLAPVNPCILPLMHREIPEQRHRILPGMTLGQERKAPGASLLNRQVHGGTE